VQDVAGEIDPRDYRVSDGEREHIGQLLHRAVGEGRITLDEFEARMAAAMAARTRGELNAQVVDIAEVIPQIRPKDVLELRGGAGGIKRRGYWVAPATIKVSGGIGDVLLDFTEAALTSAVITIEVKLGVGGLVVVVPRGSTVDHDDVRTAFGEIKDRTDRRPEVIGRGGRHFVIRGVTGTGSVKIMHPWSRRIGPFAVHRPFRVTWGARR
jgi:hypothetical protein